jgi:hypothetical protein
MFKRKNNDKHWVWTDVEGTLVDANISSSKEEDQNHEGMFYVLVISSLDHEELDP